MLTQHEIQRIIRAARKEKAGPVEIESDGAVIRIYPEQQTDPKNEWDKDFGGPEA